MKITEKRTQFEKELYKRVLAGQKGRGGEVVPHPTEDETERFINIIAGLLIDLETEVNKLEEKVALLPFRVQFTKFCKNFIQKINHDPLAFGTLIAIFAHTAIEVGIFKRFLANRG